jgi:hypothetical protein
MGKHATFCFEGLCARVSLKVNKLTLHCRRFIILTTSRCRSVLPCEGDRPEDGDVHGEDKVFSNPARLEQEPKVAGDCLTPVFIVKCSSKCNGIL